MPRQRVHHGRTVYVLPNDFPQRLKRFQEASGLPWAEIARRIGTSPYTVWRWVEGGVHPHFRHLMVLLKLAEELGLAYLLTDWRLPEKVQDETLEQSVSPRRRGRNAKNRHTWEARSQSPPC